MNDLLVKDDLIQKRTEGIQEYRFQCYRNNKIIAPNKNRSYKACFATRDSLVKTIDMQITEAELEFRSAQLLDLPAGDYQLEIREIIDDKIHAIYPSDRSLTFHIKQNNTDLPTGTVSSLTLDEFVSEFKRLIKTSSGGTGADVSIDVNKRIITVNDESLTIPAEIDLSKFASKEDLVGLVKQADIVEYAKKNEIPSTPDLTPYAKLSDLNKYATNESVDDKLSQPVKPTHPPMNYWLDRTTNPWTIHFDNGSAIQFTEYGTTPTVYGYGFSLDLRATGLSIWPLVGNIISAARGTLTLETVSKAVGSADYWSGNNNVINPVKDDADSFNWEDVFFNDASRNKKNEYQSARQKEMLKIMYKLGIWSYEDLKQFGLKKKGE
ncbi:hypothetical protein E5338_01140 [Limosilactobacillus reuteri]|uniref:hypothetical protein n=1 Tax=Limosilactobacillus reuteri TaxID=1598 RepID=UPI001093FBD1|nr:hypothetical protein [Limosilactobacillus reuteri]TGY49844.1 hypothetical protein E5338_01140 [Limosilactobacillus reuteri]